MAHTSTYSTTAEIRQTLGATSMKVYHKVSTFRGMSAIVLEWVIIIATAMLGETYFSWPLYVLGAIVIGARLLALGLLMHDAVHQLLSRNRLLNDWVAELFCSWPLFVSMRAYRVKYLVHHASLNTNDDRDYTAKTDVDWRFPMKRFKFLRIVLVQLSGLGIFKALGVMSSAQMKVKKKQTPLWYHLARLGYYSLIISSFVAFGKGEWLLLYWIIPFLTWTQLASPFRRIAEHSAIEGKSANYWSKKLFSFQ